MIDEFAQTIENIIKYEDEGIKSAISLLKAHRELRQDIKFSQKVTFIYAGSIGLESVVAKMDAIKHINDLNSIKVSPLSQSEAQEFTQQLFTNNNINTVIFYNCSVYLLRIKIKVFMSFLKRLPFFPRL